MITMIAFALTPLLMFSSLFCLATDVPFPEFSSEDFAITDETNSPLVNHNSSLIQDKKENQAFKNFIEAKAAYFYPTDKRFRNIYSGNGIYGLEYDRHIWHRFFVWSEVDYFHQSGKTDIDIGSINGTLPSSSLKSPKSNRTCVTIVPCSIGLKYFFNKDPIPFYLGAGGTATFLHTHVDSRYLVKERSKWGFGGAFKGGLLFHIKRAFLIDLFVDYYLIEAHPHRTHHRKVITHSINLSGCAFGGAFGYAF